MILAASIVLCAFAVSSASAQSIDGPGTYYGFDLPEPFYNYWNYTSDVKDMSAAMASNNFAAAADIWTNGKNNRRNATHMRVMQDGAVRDRTNETWFDMYRSFFKSVTYLKDLIDPPLYGNGSFAGACCGERAAAVDIYNRLWLVMYAQHEVDAGVRIPAADEATHGFAVVSSPVDQAHNYWEWVEKYSSQTCLRKPLDAATGKYYAATNIAYRDGFQAMFEAIGEDKPEEQRTKDIAAAQKALADQVMVQFMQVMLVEARQAVYSPISTANACNKRCLRPAHKAAVDAAWQALGPLVARSSDTSSIDAVNRLLRSTPGKKWLVKRQQQLKSYLAKITASLGVDFRAKVYACRI
uniref:Uncharacterized protein n=1 Tax=Tetradesmus obliquus TaxID=3088 RepID=A0A383VTM6_TETOB|eukprot:jgi/Sobl393_1/9699/SZX67746.1